MSKPKITVVDTAVLNDKGQLVFESTGKPVRICIDADCPNCDWPERWFDFGKMVYGCNKCEYTSEERNA